MGNCVGGKGGKKDPKLLTDEEIKLLMDNTRLTKPQILALHRNFLKECPSGKLTKKDFVKLFKEVHPSDNKKEKANKFCEYVFKVIDKDKLGYISFQEFVLCFILTSDGDFKDKCDFAFRLYDLDKDNQINTKEMTKVLTALYDLSGITDRKGDAAPKNKVLEIIKKINVEHAPEPEPEPVDDKKKKKKAKKPKAPTFITKDQFVAACSSDEQIKELFVDSIFCGGDDAQLTFSMPGGEVEAPSFSVNQRSVISIDGGDDSLIQVNTNAAAPDVDGDASFKVEAPSLEVKSDAPLFEVKSDAPLFEVKGEAPSLEINAEAPALEVNAEAPAVEINAEAPALDVNIEAPSVEVNAEAPKVEVKAE